MSSLGVLDNVLEAEGAVTGQSFAFAPAAQILPVGSFGIHVARSQRTRTACLVAGLETRSTVSGGAHAHYIMLGDYKVSYVACYVFNSVRVEFLLAFSAKLFEINLVGEVEVIKRKTNPSAFCDFHASPYLCPGRTTRTRSPTAGYTLCSDNIRTSAPETGHNTVKV